jgi:hypothetical protein
VSAARPGPPLSWSGGQLDGTQWQGIRHLSLDLAPGTATPATLTVHLNHVAGSITPSQVTVSGGRRIPPPPYQCVISGSAIVLKFAAIGDHSPYTVALLDGGGRALHPFFAAAQFTFTIDCETGDCRPSPLQAVKPPTQPPTVDLLTKDFGGFVTLLTDWVRVHNPALTDLSSASFERILIDLLAWAADMTSYYQDRVAGEAFIQTATQRFSLRQQAILLGTSVDDGQAPATILGVDVQNSGFVPDGLQVRARTAPDEVPVSFVTSARSRVRPENSSTELQVAAFTGAAGAEIPVGAQQLLLWGHGVQARAGDRLALVQGGFSQVVTLSDDPAKITEAGWVASPEVTFDPGTDPPAPITLVRWSQPLTQALQPWGWPPLLLYGNLVDGMFGTPRTAVAGGLGRISRNQVPLDLSRRGSVLTRSESSPVMLLRALRIPEWPVVHEDGVPVVQLDVGGEVWTRVEHLLSSQSYHLHYVAEADEDGAVWLRFGDGVKGREIPLAPGGRPVAAIRVDYRIGDPVTGNVGAGTVGQVVRPTDGTDEQLTLDALGTVAVTNVVPAIGGRRPQTLDQIRQHIPASLRHDVLRRAVALADYAAAAIQVPGVARATARTGGGPFNAVVVLIDPEGGGDLKEKLRQRVHDHIDAVRMTGREHLVLAAEYVPLEVALLLCAEPGTALDLVRDRVLAELRPGTPDHPGWFHPDRLSFGDTIRLGDLLAFVQGIPGVRSVKATAFRPQQNHTGPAVQDVVLLGRTKVARLDADPDAPDNGTLEVAMIGLDADGAEIVIDGDLAASAGARP